MGCPPLEDRYVPSITENRIKRLGAVKGGEFRLLLERMSNEVSASDMQRLEELVAESDNCHIIRGCNSHRPDSRMYQSVWAEAATLRTKGELKEMVSRIHCPLYFIHGNEDPHPVEGITVPLNEMNVKYRMITLEHCGHSPFLEMEIHDSFYCLLYRIIRTFSNRLEWSATTQKKHDNVHL